MDSQRLQVAFQDSSDDGGSHVAALDVVADGDNDVVQVAGASSGWGGAATGSHRSGSHRGTGRSHNSGGGGGGGGWLGNAVLQGVARLMGQTEPSHAPYAAGDTNEDGVSMGGHDDNDDDDDDGGEGDNWGYGVYNNDPYGSSSDTHSSDVSLTSSAMMRMEEQQRQYEEEANNYEINLHETVQQYLRTPEDLYLNIILATIKTGTTQVTADVFRVAAGCPLLIKTFLDSGHADVDNPDVQAILQNELNMVLSGDPYDNDFVSEGQADYLRCLCDVKGLRINQRQMVLMRYSGFEFIKMLYDCPHLMEDIVVQEVWVHALFRCMNLINMTASWVGVLVSTLFTATVIWMAVLWFENDAHRNNGYWTVLCYGGGYVVSLVTAMRTEQHKITEYEVRLWPFPNNNFNLIPALPVYHLLLVVTAFRYELTANKTHYFVIRYDLHNAIGMQVTCHGICHAIPQIIVQIFLFTEKEGEPKSTQQKVCFWILVGCCCASFFMGVFAYVRMSTFSHSCDAFGFAVSFVESVQDHLLRLRRVKPSDIATRVLLLFTTCMLIAASVTMFIFLLNIGNCDAGSRTYLGVFFAVVGLSFITLVCMLVYAPFSRAFGIFCLPAVALMVAFFPYTKARSQAESDLPIEERCAMLTYHFSSVMVPLFVTFGSVCSCLLTWLAMVTYEYIRGERIQQRFVDNYLER